MGISEKLRNDNEELWTRILNHPFVNELYSGTLPMEKFRYYIIQDYNYLVTLYRVLSIVASKSNYEIARFALEAAYIDSTVEMDNYIRLLPKLDLTLEEVLNTDPAPTNTAYMNFLLATSLLDDPIVGLTALLPCFWTYLDIAEYHRGDLISNTVEIYREWADAYYSTEYRNMVNRMRGLIDKYGVGISYSRLNNVFKQGLRYEYLFWEMAYNMEKWGV